MHCPGCGAVLVDTEMGEARFAACEACGGALVPNNRLIALMKALAGLAIQDLDLESPVPPAPKRAVPPRCPGCGKPMHAFGYLGSHLAPLYRCPEHLVVYGDEQALGTAVLLYARSNHHILERQSKNAELRESWARSTRARAAGHAAAQTAMMGYMFGGVPGAVVGALAHDKLTRKS